jgi:hypothetical protein
VPFGAALNGGLIRAFKSRQRRYFLRQYFTILGSALGSALPASAGTGSEFTTLTAPALSTPCHCAGSTVRRDMVTPGHFVSVTVHSFNSSVFSEIGDFTFDF